MDIPPRITDPRGLRYVAERATGLAERQFGPIARWQLRELGFSEARVRSWLESGRLHVRHPGVYALGRPSLDERGDLAAALLFAGRGAALSSITALWWIGLLERRPDLIHIDAPGRRASRREISIRHPARVERFLHRELPVVALPRALQTSADILSRNSMRLVLARAEYRKVLDLPSLMASLGSGRNGSAAIRAAVASHLPQLARCESQLEIDFVLLCERFRIELPEPNVRISRWRPDMLWREQRLIVELDGRDAHSSSAQIASDERRAAELRRRGFIVVRFTWAQVHFEQEFVVSELRRLRSP